MTGGNPWNNWPVLISSKGAGDIPSLLLTICSKTNSFVSVSVIFKLYPAELMAD